MDNYVVARPYAKAIFAIAKDEKRFEAWGDILKTLAMISQDTQVSSMLANPKFDQVKRAKIFLDVCGEHLGKIGEKFVLVLAQNHRLPMLPTIGELYEELCHDYEGIIKAKAISAVELTEVQKERLHNVLSERFNEKVDLSYEIDKSLIGGLLIRVGIDRVFDASILGRLNRLKKEL